MPDRTPLEKRLDAVHDVLVRTNDNLLLQASTQEAHGREIEKTAILLNSAIAEFRTGLGEMRLIKKDISDIGAQLGAVAVETHGRIEKVEDGVAGFAWLGRMSKHPLATPISVAVLIVFNFLVMYAKSK